MAHQRELCADLRKRITRTIVPMEYHSQNRMSIRNHTGVQALESLKVTAIGREPCSAPGLFRGQAPAEFFSPGRITPRSYSRIANISRNLIPRAS
jgi:hypothetical protein